MRLRRSKLLPEKVSHTPEQIADALEIPVEVVNEVYADEKKTRDQYKGAMFWVDDPEMGEVYCDGVNYWGHAPSGAVWCWTQKEWDNRHKDKPKPKPRFTPPKLVPIKAPKKIKPKPKPKPVDRKPPVRKYKRRKK